MKRTSLLWLFWICCVLGVLLVAACGPEATPYPVDIPSATTSTPQTSDTSTIRYALAANTNGLVSDLSLIQASAQIEQLTEAVNPADLGNRYDLVAAYGDLPGSM